MQYWIIIPDVGDSVQVDEVVAILETDKIQVTSFWGKAIQRQ